MAKQLVGIGTTINDGTGDSLRVGADKINDNFNEIYNVVGNGTTTFVGIVSQITAGTNVSVSTAFGSVEVGVSTTPSFTSIVVGSAVTGNSSGVNVTGVVTATGGFVSVGNTTPIQITLSGSVLTFTASGIGSTSFTLA